jgi:L-histidine Nalpha-methyltransferase
MDLSPGMRASDEPAASSTERPTPHPTPDEVMLRDVLEGLRMPQKELSPKYFYDAHGSELFERITELEEYYPTRTERALLERWAGAWVAASRPRALVELGAGSAEKSRLVIDAMEEAGTGDLYVPVDVSGEFLHDTARRLRAEYESLRVEPEVADISVPFDLPGDLPRPAWIALLGSTIGNFPPREAARLLGRVADQLRPGDRFLMGVDLRPGPGKSVERLERAYNDERGVTADFNLNVLRVLNRDLGADFDLAAFEHRAFYDPREHRIEMHLVAKSPQEARVGDEIVRIEASESIRTELSCKHERTSIEALFAEAGLCVERWQEDEDGAFALVLAGLARPAT